MARFVSALLLAVSVSASARPLPASTPPPLPYVVVLGVAQDAGYPHAGCRKSCCARAWSDPRLRRHVASLAIVDPVSSERWIIDATPDFTAQLQRLNDLTMPGARPLDAGSPIASHLALDGILLTHAHIGHYTGLMYLGREGIGARRVPVYAMPRMKAFLESNGPWSQLVSLENIELRPLADGARLRLNGRISVTPIAVPHRDEFSETVAFVISGTKTSVLYLPDIDKWDRWSSSIEAIVATVDRAYVDGTFYADGEVAGRSMKEIPHPFVQETMARFAGSPGTERSKIRFIHLNHTNPALDPKGAARKAIVRAGFAVAEEGERFTLP
ncbi:MAG: MBL fold metallo-hydrolase [Thermoanaerobaculia bacterium]